VTPYDYSLRELLWRWEAIQQEEWDKAGWIALSALQPWSRKRLSINDTNPIRGSIAKDNERTVQAHLELMRKQLPKRGERTQEESDAAFEAAYRRQYGSE
jgi:hypothetical protein